MTRHARRYHLQKGQIDYWLLLLVIIIGVTAGNLLSNWITARIAVHQLEQSVVGFSQQLTSDQAASVQRQQQRLEQSRQQTRNQRANSRIGLFLAKSCEEWKTTNQRYDNHTSQQEMRKVCDQYEKFLETGIAPGNGF